MASQNLEPFNFDDLNDKIDGKNPLIGVVFLFFLFFFTFLVVYFLYICTNNHRQNNRNGPSAGLDNATLSSLPVFTYGGSSRNKKSPSSQEAECAICLSFFQEGDTVKVLPGCYHGFHSECVDQWLRTRSTCPLCRGRIVRGDSLSQGSGSGIP